MDLADCQRFHYVREKEKDNSSCLSLGNPYKQEIISWLEYSFVSTALDTLPSMLILRIISIALILWFIVQIPVPLLFSTAEVVHIILKFEKRQHYGIVTLKIEMATSLNPQVEQMISTFLSYAPDLTKRQLSLGNPYKQEIISWLEYSFVSTALDTLPSMLILRVTGSIFHQQNRLILDHSRLNRMNITRSTCVIIVSNLVTWVSGKMKLQNVNENMLRKFTPLHKLKKDIFSMGIHINKKPPAGGNIHVSTALDTLPSILILRVTESFGINASILNNMNNTRPRYGNSICQKSENSRLNDGHFILAADLRRWTIRAFILHQRLVWAFTYVSGKESL
ncbi:hypothetical protein T01_11708 [Trichinella spiralis]|uniref:Uncharacterized protein n=1 Tax=Trichinella spiralis TaxID=6334 RepID=A0A0V1BDR3_TRISP|nr:hypothetical protein T01_11708 [Trichinella spiralis]